MERLYQPDFTCIFGNTFGDAFSYGKIDSLIWPIFSDIPHSDALNNLLKLKDNQRTPLFYKRKLSIEDEKIEFSCSGIHRGLVQAMDIGKSYGISNSDVIKVIGKEPTIFKGILSFDLSNNAPEKNSIIEIERIQKQIPVCGIVIYPSFIKLELLDNANEQLKQILKFCSNKSLFIKIDLGNFKFPDNHREYTTLERIESFVSKYPNNTIILSGIDVASELERYVNILKKYVNLWIEIDPRAFGGMTPTDIFKNIFNIKGLIQNFWYRISIGSATPTLEISQITRGFLEATELLPFSQKNLLRSWIFRNINRLNSTIFQPINQVNCNTFIKIKESYHQTYGNQILSRYKIQLRSYSITQLLFLTDIIKKIFHDALKKYPNLNDGEVLIRSYHTTTSLLINEHEIGNYLDLHYYFAELSKEDSSKFMHTVLAKENRADFNHLDHRIASTYGSKQLIIPIINRELELGTRENFYILTTFGPRTLDLFIEVKLYKEN